MKISPFLKIILGLLTVLFFYHTLRDNEHYFNYLELTRSKHTLEKAIGKLEAEKINLEGEIKKIKSSKSYAQKVLRDNYHLLEEDEQILFFAD